MVKNIDKKLICSIKKHINNELLKLQFYHPKINMISIIYILKKCLL